MLPASYATATAVLLAVGGALSCFAGYRLFRFVLGLIGFVIGAMVTTSIVGESSAWTMVLAAVGGGIVGGVLMVAAYFLGVGLAGALLAAIALNSVWRFVGGDPPIWLLVVCCVVSALGALSVARYVAIFFTAIVGSWALILGVLTLLGDRKAMTAASAGGVWVLYPGNPLPAEWWGTLLWFGLTLAGIIIQMATTTRTGAKKQKTVK